MNVKKALKIVEKRVRCANLSSMNYCHHNCPKCEYTIEPGTEKEYAEALEFVWKTAKTRIIGSAVIKEEVEPICKHLSPCGLCDVQTKAFGMIMKCSEVTKDARNS